MESRDKILEAAARVYGQHGFRGATTRRIADEAGVNEITVFRHFGSKETLINEALQRHAHVFPCSLPAVPLDPERELLEWATAHLQHLRSAASIIRKTMGDLEERPESLGCVADGPMGASRDLRAYLQRLEEHGFVSWAKSDDHVCPDPLGASAMLMGALFADAMGREIMPDIFPQPMENAPAIYVRLFLCAIRTPLPQASSSPAPTATSRDQP